MSESYNAEKINAVWNRVAAAQEPGTPAQDEGQMLRSFMDGAAADEADYRTMARACRDQTNRRLFSAAAAAKARSLLAQHRSRRAIADVLRRKGVERPVAEAVLEELYAPEGAPAGALPVGWAVNGAGPDAQAAEAPRDPELEAAAALVRRQYARRLAEGREDLVLAALARRGFSYRTARAALACAAQGAQPGES